MKNVSQNKFKKKSQIFKLKTILNDVNNESNLLNSKIIELQKILKFLKKIMNERRNELSKTKKNKKDLNEDQIKQQICNKLSNFIKTFNEGIINTSFSNTNKEYKKIIKEKTKNLNIVLKTYKYKKLKKVKDLLIQEIKEKKNICYSIEGQIDYEKDLSSIYHPKNFNFFDNLYNTQYKYLNIDNKLTNKEIFLNQNRIQLKQLGIKSINYLKQKKNNYMKKINNYRYDNGFDFMFINKRYKEKYDIEFELINESDYSSDSELDDSDEEESDIKNYLIKINKNKDNNKIYINDNIYIKNYINKDIKNKPLYFPSIVKDISTPERINNKNLKNNKVILVNKLVEIKEKYNKLMNERYELEYKKNKIKNKIENIKDTIKMNTYYSYRSNNFHNKEKV